MTENCAAMVEADQSVRVLTVVVIASLGAAAQR